MQPNQSRIEESGDRPAEQRPAGDVDVSGNGTSSQTGASASGAAPVQGAGSVHDENETDAGDEMDEPRNEGGGAISMQSLATVVDLLSGRFDRITSFVKDKSIGELVEDAEEYARREPVIFYGGAALLGFGIARVLRATAASEEEGDAIELVTAFDDEEDETPGTRRANGGTKRTSERVVAGRPAKAQARGASSKKTSRSSSNRSHSNGHGKSRTHRASAR